VTGWFDSHAHLWALSSEPDDALERARAAGVHTVICVGTDAASSQASLAVAARHDDVRATVGLHPHDAVRLDDEWDTLVALASSPGVVAIGETGLDFYYEHSPAAAQESAFRRHIALANQLDRGGKPQSQAVRLTITKELPASYRLPGKQPLTEQVLYALLYNFLNALTKTGVAVCGASIVKPLAGRTEA